MIIKLVINFPLFFPGMTTGAVSLKTMKLINVLTVVIETGTGIVVIRTAVGCLVMMKKNNLSGSQEGPLGMLTRSCFMNILFETELITLFDWFPMTCLL